MGMVWIDQTGTNSKDFHYFCGHHMLGMMPASHTLKIRGKRISVLTAIYRSTRSIENIHMIQNTMDGDTFGINFVPSSIVPNVQPFDGLVVMDNASIHCNDIN